MEDYIFKNDLELNNISKCIEDFFNSKNNEDCELEIKLVIDKSGLKSSSVTATEIERIVNG